MKKVSLFFAIFCIKCFADGQPLSPTQQQQIFDSSNNFANQYQNSNVKPTFNGNNIQQMQNNFNSASNTNIDYAHQSNTYDSNFNMNNSVYGNYENAKNQDYLYNTAKDKLAKCKTANDPECTTLTKYNDDDAMNTRHAYSIGNGNYYYRTQSRPDPANETCTIVTKWNPVNETTNYCMVGNIQKVNCNTSMSVYQSYQNHYCYDSLGQCEQYKNSSCQLIQSEVLAKCNTWQYTVNTCWKDQIRTCQAGTNYIIPDECGHGAVTRQCGINYGEWTGRNLVCLNQSDAQPAMYSCTYNNYVYNDGCKNFR